MDGKDGVDGVERRRMRPLLVGMASAATVAIGTTGSRDFSRFWLFACAGRLRSEDFFEDMIFYLINKITARFT